MCISGEEFVKAIVTLPAFALSVLFVYFSSPLGLAAMARLPEAPVDAVEVEVDAVVEVDAGALAADDVVPLLLDPPQATRPRASAMLLSARAMSLSIGTISSRLVIAPDDALPRARRSMMPERSDPALRLR